MEEEDFRRGMDLLRPREEYGFVPDDERLKAGGLERFFMPLACAAERLKLMAAC